MSGLMDAEWQMLADAAEHTADASCWKRGCDDSLPGNVERIVAAREVEAGRQALRDAADEWQQGEWTVLMPKIKRAENASRILGTAQAVTDWLRNRADGLGGTP